MKIDLNLKFYKAISAILALLLLALLLLALISFSFKNNNESNMISQKDFYENSNKNNESQSDKVTYTEDKHRLSACGGNSILESENEFASSSKEVNGYKVLLNCDYAINTYYPDRKDEYFYTLDIKNNIKYYINDNKKYVIGSPKILGAREKNVFITYCYEGCSGIQMFDLKDRPIEDKETNIFPYEIGQVLARNKIYSNDLFVLNNKVIIIYENKIYEFDESNFTLKVIKEISSDKVFGKYGGMGGELSAEYKTEGNNIKYYIYKKDDVINDKDGKPVETGYLEIK